MEQLCIENQEIKQKNATQMAEIRMERVKNEELQGLYEEQMVKYEKLEMTVIDLLENEEAMNLQRMYLTQLLEEKEKEIRALNEHMKFVGTTKSGQSKTPG